MTFFILPFIKGSALRPSLYIGQQWESMYFFNSLHFSLCCPPHQIWRNQLQLIEKNSFCFMMILKYLGDKIRLYALVAWLPLLGENEEAWLIFHIRHFLSCVMCFCPACIWFGRIPKTCESECQHLFQIQIGFDNVYVGCMQFSYFFSHNFSLLMLRKPPEQGYLLQLFAVN